MMHRAYKNRIQQRRGDNSTSFFAVFFLISIRFLYFGFHYFPQLDDYIQHHNYAATGTFFSVLQKFGLLAARPLAGVLDITLWSWLWPSAIIGVLLLSAVYAIAAVEFYKLFSKLFGTSPFFLIVFTLLPLGVEGTYWMSASTRILPGLLLAALSAKYFCYVLEDGGKRNMTAAFLLQFLAFCFYEQAAVLSCALNVLLGLLYIRQSKRWALSFTCVGAAILYFAFTALTGPSALYDGRTQVILPTTAYYFQTFLPDLLSQMRTAFLEGGWYTFAYGFIRGIMRIVKDGAWLWCLGTLVACVLFAYFCTRAYKEGRGKYLFPLGIGFLLILAPLTPFFVIANPWFSLRGTVTSFVGIALVLDCVARLFFGNNRVAIAFTSSLLAGIFCVCSASEIADYRANYLADHRVVQTVSTLADKHASGSKIAVLNVEPSYVSEQNFKYHEHVVGVTESAWALTGAVRCYNENTGEGITYVPFSMKESVLYKKWNFAEKTIGSMDGVYLYDPAENRLEELKVVYMGDGRFDLCFSDGEKYGTIIENEEIGQFVEE